MFRPRHAFSGPLGLLLSVIFLCPPQDATAAEVQVAVAANFTAPMQKIAADFEKDTGHKAVLAFGTVGKFFAQMKAGAPFEVLVSADRETPDALVREGPAINETRFTYAIGKLAPGSATPGFVDGKGDILRSGAFRHLALANPKLAVYGAAGLAAMKKLSVWDSIEAKLVTGENITQAYRFAASGNAELGFVAVSQIIGSDGDGKIAKGSVWMVLADLYPQLAQDVVLMAHGKDSEAAKALNRPGFAGGSNSRENGAMEAKKTTNKFSPEVRARAVRTVQEHQGEYASQWAAITSIAAKIGCTGETLRSWVRRASRRTRCRALRRQHRRLL